MNTTEKYFVKELEKELNISLSSFSEFDQIIRYVKIPPEIITKNFDIFNIERIIKTQRLEQKLVERLLLDTENICRSLRELILIYQPVSSEFIRSVIKNKSVLYGINYKNWQDLGYVDSDVDSSGWMKAPKDLSVKWEKLNRNGYNSFDDNYFLGYAVIDNTLENIIKSKKIPINLVNVLGGSDLYMRPTPLSPLDINSTVIKIKISIQTRKYAGVLPDTDYEILEITKNGKLTSIINRGQ